MKRVCNTCIAVTRDSNKPKSFTYIIVEKMVRLRKCGQLEMGSLLFLSCLAKCLYNKMPGGMVGLFVYWPKIL